MQWSEQEAAAQRFSCASGFNSSGSRSFMLAIIVTRKQGRCGADSGMQKYHTMGFRVGRRRARGQQDSIWERIADTAKRDRGLHIPCCQIRRFLGLGASDMRAHAVGWSSSVRSMSEY